VVTPEAVVLDFETAGLASRSLAFVIDLALQATALLVLGAAAAVVTPAGDGGWVAIAALALIGFAVLFGYPIAGDTLGRGRTIGKMALGLRVVTVEGGPPRLRHAAIRAAVGLLDFYVPPGGPVAVVSVLVTRRDQRLGDVVAGTLVLRERTAAPLPTAIWFPPPPGYEGYAAGLDVSAVTAEEYGLVRAYLIRAWELSPEARAALALRLANPLATKLAHQPPAWVGPDAFLACLAAAYQRAHPPVP
jgi:uncharacterized RDD family membrane protein YckC